MKTIIIVVKEICILKIKLQLFYNTYYYLINLEKLTFLFIQIVISPIKEVL